jgi:hypothetical protein
VGTGSNRFFKKGGAKNFYFLWDCGVEAGTTQSEKVFCFFFSKKKRFASTRPARRGMTVRHHHNRVIPPHIATGRAWNKPCRAAPMTVTRPPPRAYGPPPFASGPAPMALAGLQRQRTLRGRRGASDRRSGRLTLAAAKRIILKQS